MPAVYEQLIHYAVTVNRCSNDYSNSSSGSVCSANSCEMAACDDDPRLMNKVTRTPGRNISKLKRLFDSQEHAVDSNCIRSEESGTTSSLVESREISEMEKQKLDSTNIGNASSENILSKFRETANLSSSSTTISSAITTENELIIDQSIHQSTKDIPYCRKVSHGDLWKNVDIGVKSSSEGLWSTSNCHDFSSDDSHCDNESLQFSNSFVASTAELNDLIAVSRAELSKKKEPFVSDKSTLENYFTTAFENSKPKKFVPFADETTSVDSSVYKDSNNELFQSSLTFPLDCEVDDMTFDDDDAALSDTSSEEELRCHPASTNAHYLPAYALHTIIEESCEESERDSRGATPTNEAVTSKLERYFSWDIINDSEHDLKKKDDDESTIYSDSLSEGSGSLGDSPKDIDPSQLASSRLEKYFTSGLVGNDNYFYPDDAEFLDDAPVSDFEEDSIHQKISRSALLNSLETKPISNNSKTVSSILEEVSEESQNSVKGNSEKCNETVDFGVIDDCDKLRKDEEELVVPNSKIGFQPEQITECQITECSSQNTSSNLNETESNSECHSKDNVSQLADECVAEVVSQAENVNNIDLAVNNNDPPESLTSEVSNSDKSTSAQNQIVNKEQLALDAQAIIKKLLVYFTDSASESFRENMETDYISAWHILETEIERLMQSISPTMSLENNSCNSSTIDSNNSDYGSDTIESIDCITDEDDSADSKSRLNNRYSNFLNYKIQPEHDLNSFNISDESVSIWKRLIQSLQKDSSFMSENKIFDPSTEARLYIRDQIVMLMHTVTVSESSSLKGQSGDVLISNEMEVSIKPDEKESAFCDINEAYNVNVNNSKLLTQLSEDNAVEQMVMNSRAESSDEGISVDSNENLHSTTEKPIHNNKLVSDKLPLINNSENIQIRSEETVGETDCSSHAIADDENSVSKHILPYLSESPLLSSKEKIHVDEIDLKHCNKSALSNKKSSRKDSDSNFSVFVDIELSDGLSTVTERKSSDVNLQVCDKQSTMAESESENFQICDEQINGKLQLPSCQLSADVGESKSITSDLNAYDLNTHNIPENMPSTDNPNDELHSALKENVDQSKSYRDTGYYSFKSSEDSLLNAATPVEEFVDVPNFKSLKRSVKKFPVSNTLSKSTNNIHQVFSVPDTKFNTLQAKTQKSKVSMNPNSSPSRQFTSLFSPSAVFKKLTGTKSNDAQTPESTIPAKYLKKYARSSSADNESIFGAISMPHLNNIRPGDSYSAIGLYYENDKDSSLTLDEDSDAKPYTSYSQSVLSLGSHSASMTSVYSAAGCHYGYVTVSGDVLFGLNYNQKSQMMEVFVKQCRNLAAVDTRRNKSDPYVKVYLLPDKTKSGKRKTKTKKNTLNPVFNELLRFPVLKHELDSRTLWLSVWNSDLFGRNEFLGEITLPLGYRLLDSPTLRWYPLQERMESLTSPLNYRGELFLALKYVPRDLSLETRFRPAPFISLTGALHVLVKEARNISTSRSSGVLDAFCKCYLLPDKLKSSKQKTPVVKKSRHPKWYYTVIYENLSLEELKERGLELTVWDHDRLTSNEFLGGIRLNAGTGLYHGISVEWMDARRDEAALWQAMLQNPNTWVDGSLPLRPTMQFHHG